MGKLGTPSLEDFFRAVWPADCANYCVTRKPVGSQYFTDVYVDTIEAAVREGEIAGRMRADVFFAIAGLHKKSRKREGVEKLKVLTADIDVKPDKTDGKAYVSLDEAAKGFAAARAAGMPQPTFIVRSGMGLHLYWCLSRELDQGTWSILAKGWDYYLTSLNLLHDAVRTTGDYSILRVPETQHWKDPQNPKPVFISHHFPEAIYDPTAVEALLKTINAPMAPARVPSKVNPAMSQFLGGLVDRKPIEIEKVGAVCPQLQAVLDSKGNVIEPLWWNMLSFAARDPDPEAKAQQYSCGHPSYTQQGTTKKLSDIQSGNNGDGYAAAGCGKWESDNPGGCDGCPKKGLMGHPLTYAFTSLKPVSPVATPAATPLLELLQQGDEAILPLPYIIGINRTVCTQVLSPDGQNQEAECCPYYIVPITLIKDEAIESYVMRMRYEHPINGEKIDLDIPMALTAEEKGLVKFLHDNGLFIADNFKRTTLDYIVFVARWLQRSKPEYVAAGTMGWTKGREGFIVGDDLFMPGAEFQHATSQHIKEITDDFHPQGTAENWYSVANMFKEPGCEIHAFSILAALGSPLFHLSRQHGIIYNLHGRGGTGKTTILRLMASVWGKPNENAIKTGDTVKAQQAVFASCGSLPVTYDEVTNLDEEMLSNLTLDVTSGRAGRRLNRDTSMRKNQGSWDFVLCCSSNNSLYDMLNHNNFAAAAQQSRVLELPVVVGNMDRHRVRAAETVLFENYGHAGREFIRFVVANPGLVQQMYAVAYASLTKRYDTNGRGRFIIGLATAALVAGQIMATRLGKLEYDMKRVAKFATDHITPALTRICDESGLDPLELLTRYLREFTGSFFEYAEQRSGAGVTYFVPPSASRTNTRLRGVLIKDRLYLARIDFQGWLQDRRANMEDLIQGLHERGVLLHASVAQPMQLNSNGELWGATACIAVDADHPALTGRVRAVSSAAKIINLVTGNAQATGP